MMDEIKIESEQDKWIMVLISTVNDPIVQVRLGFEQRVHVKISVWLWYRV